MGSLNSTANPNKIYPDYIYEAAIPQNPQPEDPTLKDLLFDPSQGGEPENGQYRVRSHNRIGLPNIQVWRSATRFPHLDFGGSPGGWQLEPDYAARQDELEIAMNAQRLAHESCRRARSWADSKAYTRGPVLEDALNSMDAAEAAEKSANARVAGLESGLNTYYTGMMDNFLEQLRIGRIEAWRERQRQAWDAPENEADRNQYEAEWHAEQQRLQQQRDADTVAESERQRREDQWRWDAHARYVSEESMRRAEALRRGEEEYRRRQQEEAERRRREEVRRQEGEERRAREQANSNRPWTQAEQAHKHMYETMWGRGTWTRQAYWNGRNRPEPSPPRGNRRSPPRGNRRVPTPPRRRRSKTPTPPRQDPDYVNKAQIWLQAISAALADHESMTTFPVPPHQPCSNPSCAMTAGTRVLKACTCNIRDCFSVLDNDALKGARIRLHPDKFSRCRQDRRDAFQAMAQALFVVVDALLKERRERRS